MSRIFEKFNKELAPQLMKEFKYTSPMQVPQLKKIVLNCGVGESTANIKVVDYAVYALTQISGQKPLVNKSKKAISNFKLRQGLPVAVSVTMRRQRMYDFLDRLVSVALPRVRDFRGCPTTGFDGHGNYTLGLKEQIVFPEVVMEKLDKVRGLDITFVTTARTDEEGRALLTYLGIPFKKADVKEEKAAA